MAIGYWVAPTPDMSTRSWAWAVCRVNNATVEAISPTNRARHRRGLPVVAEVRLVISFLLLIVHAVIAVDEGRVLDRKSTRLNSSHVAISYAVFCLSTQ